jgi:hypothetical protein
MFAKNNSPFDRFLHSAINQRTLIFSTLIVLALFAFEIFNYSTTEFAMADLLGDLKFGGMRWSTILALAFCGIDFAGIARLFTPEQGAAEPTEVWYLLGAWLIAATMNATLTWWGVSIAIIQHQSLGNAVIARETLLSSVPVFVAIMVWLSRVLIIGTFSVAGERILWQSDKPNQQNHVRNNSRRSSPSKRTNSTPVRRPSNRQINNPSYARSFSPAPKPNHSNDFRSPNRPENASRSGNRNFE